MSVMGHIPKSEYSSQRNYVLIHFLDIRGGGERRKGLGIIGGEFATDYICGGACVYCS